ncbi:hypothetical protein EGW08_018235 [Elysia chlorotica]|uniref:Uncharacterized protein n=1 Tax=Elysia chlorotica TaxID=188477 RepID=A0A3S1AWG7_ELYCH|nr:hypothetical protein EGW08_018235 [Elysia chlorotica]
MDILIEPSRRKSSFLIRDILGDTGNVDNLKSSAHVGEEAANQVQELNKSDGSLSPDLPSPDKTEESKTFPQTGDFVLRNSTSGLLGKSLHNFLNQESHFFENIFKERLFLHEKGKFMDSQHENHSLNAVDVNLKTEESKSRINLELVSKQDEIKRHSRIRKTYVFDPCPEIKTARLDNDERLGDEVSNAEQNSSPEQTSSNRPSSPDLQSGSEYRSRPSPDFSREITERHDCVGNLKNDGTWSRDDAIDFERKYPQHQNTLRKDQRQEISSRRYNIPPTATLSPDVCTSTSTSPQQHPSKPSPRRSVSPPSPKPPKASMYTPFQPLFNKYFEVHRTGTSVDNLGDTKLREIFSSPKNKDQSDGTEKSEGRDYARHNQPPAGGFGSRDTASVLTSVTRPLPQHAHPLNCLRTTSGHLPPMMPFRVSQHQALHPGLIQPVTSSNRAHLSAGHPCLGFPHLASAGFLSRGEFKTIFF